VTLSTAPLTGRLAAPTRLLPEEVLAAECANELGVTVTAAARRPVRPPRHAHDRLGHVIAEPDPANGVVAALERGARPRGGATT
jgi:hypothetical protein